MDSSLIHSGFPRRPRRRFARLTASILTFCLASVSVGADETTSTEPTAGSTDGRASESPVDRFYQQISILRTPRFVVQGMNLQQQIEYKIESTFELYAADDRGNRRAVQTVRDARMVQADPLSYAAFSQSLAEMRGQVFTYKIDSFGQMVSMEGHRDNTKEVKVERPASQGLLMTTVIDEDGWKELAVLTLFQPPPRGRSGRSFVRKTTHDWGSLGSWYGKTEYVGRPLGRDTKRYSYKHALKYMPPDKDAPPPSNPLPLKIDSAEFRAYEAWGEIHYDTKLKRVRAVQETFHARGSIDTTFLGTTSRIDVDEKQIFQIKIVAAEAISAGSSAGEASSAGGLRATSANEKRPGGSPGR